MQIIQESYIALEQGDHEEHFKLSDFKTFMNKAQKQEFMNDSLKMTIFKYCPRTDTYLLIYIFQGQRQQ